MSEQLNKKNAFSFLNNNKETPEKQSQLPPKPSASLSSSFFGNISSAQNQQNNPLGFMAQSGNPFGTNASSLFQNTSLLFNNPNQENPKETQKSKLQPTAYPGLFGSTFLKNDTQPRNSAANQNSQNSSIFSLAPNKLAKKQQSDHIPGLFTFAQNSLLNSSSIFAKKPTFDMGSANSATEVRQFLFKSTEQTAHSTFLTKKNAQRKQDNQKVSPISQQNHSSKMQTEKKSATVKGMSVEASKQKSQLKQHDSKSAAQSLFISKRIPDLFENQNSLINIEKKTSESLFVNQKKQISLENKNSHSYSLFGQQNKRNDVKTNDSSIFGISKSNELKGNKQDNKNASQIFNIIQKNQGENNKLASKSFIPEKSQSLFRSKQFTGQIISKQKLLPTVIAEHANQQQSEQIYSRKKYQIQQSVKDREAIQLQKQNNNRQQSQEGMTNLKSRKSRPNRNGLQMSAQSTQKRTSAFVRPATQISVQSRGELLQTKEFREKRQRAERNSMVEIMAESQTDKLDIQEFMKLSLLNGSQESWLYICRNCIKPLSLFIISLFNMSVDFKSGMESDFNVVIDQIEDRKMCADQQINRIYNDLFKLFLKIYSLAKEPTAVSTFADIFIHLAKEINLQTKLTEKYQQKQNVLKQRIYKSEGHGPQNKNCINEYSAEVVAISKEFGQYLETLRMNALRILIKFPKLYHSPYNIFEHNVRFLVLKQCYDQASDYRGIDKRECSGKLQEVCYCSLNQYARKYGQNYAKISSDIVCQILSFLNMVKGKEMIKKILKLLIVPMKINSPVWNDRQIQDFLSNSTSLQLLPLKFVCLKKQNASIDTQNFIPQSKDLFKFIQGSQWFDWLEFYIQGPNRYIQTSQKQLLVNSIRTFDQSSSQKVFNTRSDLFNFIMQLKRQDELIKFFMTLQGLCWSRDSVRKVQCSFFKNQQELRYYLQSTVKSIIDLEVRQDELEIHKAKICFLLKVIQVSPQMIYLYQNLLLNPLADRSNNNNISSHRICHFLIDMIKYYSYSGDSEMLARVFDSITILLKYKDTNTSMTLAMNVDRPQFTFYNLNLSHSLIQALNKQLILLLESPQFYKCFNAIKKDSFLTAADMMDLRYTDQYSELMGVDDPLNHLFPSYWLSNLMKVVPKQKYNPELLNMLVQKLQILPYPQLNNEGTIQVPFIIKTIIQILNMTNFQQHLIDHIEVGWRPSQTYSLSLYNNKLQQNYKLHYKHVLYTLKLIVTVLKLRRIRQSYTAKYPNHCVTIAIQNLECIDKVFRKLSYQNHLYDSQHYKINPITALATHMYYSDSMKNLSGIDKTEWDSVSVTQEQAQRFLEQHEHELKIIDHRLIRNFLSHQTNIYMESSENIQYLAMQSLQLLISFSSSGFAINDQIVKTSAYFQQRPIVLSQVLYAMPYSQQQYAKGVSIQRNEWVKSKFKQQLLQIIDPRQSKVNDMSGRTSLIILKQRGLRLVEQMIKSEGNRSIGFQIMRDYWLRKPERDGNVRINRCLASIMKRQIQLSNQQNDYRSLAGVQEMINAVICNPEIQEMQLSETIDQYNSSKFPIASYHQFEKMLMQRDIVKSVDFYMWLQQVLDILLDKLYARTYELDKLTSVLITFLVKHRIIAIPGYKINQLNYFDSLRQQLPRKYVRDPLQYQFSKKHGVEHLQIAHQIQRSNIVTWAMNASYRLNSSLNKFFSVILSINQTFYANLPITFPNNFNHSQIFCPSHLPPLPYSGQSLIGRNSNEAIQNVRSIGQLMTISLKQASREQNFDQTKIKTTDPIIKDVLHIMGACVDWLSCRNIPIAQKASILLTNFIFQVKYVWIKPVIKCQITARLLMTLILARRPIKDDQQFWNCISESIYDSIFEKNTENTYLNQQILSILNVLTPKFQQQFWIQMLVNLWCRETSNQFFYNESRVVVQIANKFPLAIAKLRPFERCVKLKQAILANPALRYSDNQRNADQMVWNWTLLIVKTLCNSCEDSSTIVAELINEFMRNYKHRIISILSELSTTTVVSDKCNFDITYALLEELDETLQVIALAMNMQLWTNLNRDYLQQIVYLLTHKTVCLFTSQQYVKKKFIACSQNERKLSQIKYNQLDIIYNSADQDLQHSFSFKQNNSLQFLSKHSIANRFTVFNIAMEIKYFSVLRSWQLAVSLGIGQSWYIEKYFEQSIPRTQNNTHYIERNTQNYRYSVTYWDRMNKSLMYIARSISTSLHQLLNIANLDAVLALMADSYRTSETFIDNGYLNTLFTLPSSKNQLLIEFKSHAVLFCELTMTHFIHQIAYKQKYKTLMRNHLQGFQRRVIFSCKELQQKFIHLDEQYGPFDSNYFKTFRDSIQYIQIR